MNLNLKTLNKNCCFIIALKLLYTFIYSYLIIDSLKKVKKQVLEPGEQKTFWLLGRTPRIPFNVLSRTKYFTLLSNSKFKVFQLNIYYTNLKKNKNVQTILVLKSILLFKTIMS